MKTEQHWLQTFLSAYVGLDKSNLEQLKQTYHPQVQFEDPLHKVQGIEALLEYFQHLYCNLNSCDFSILHHFENAHEAAIYWQMRFSHPQLKKGKIIEVSGHSHLKSQDGLVIYHRDYLDAGAMLYEHIPLLGSAIRLVKKRAS